jgi:prefoldin subunit 5
MGMVMLELQSSVKNIDRTLNEVKEAVDRIPGFPELAEILKEAALMPIYRNLFICYTGNALFR